MLRTFEYTVDEKFAGKPIRSILRQHFQMSTGLIAHLKNTPDGIMLNGERRFVNYDVQHGDHLVLNIREEANGEIAPVHHDIEIVYEDEDFLVINKPRNMIVYPCNKQDTLSLANAVQYYYEEKNLDCCFHAVNRLDRDTTGLMLVAKHGYAHALLAAQLHVDGYNPTTGQRLPGAAPDRFLVRKYRCIVCGVPAEKDSTDLAHTADLATAPDLMQTADSTPTPDLMQPADSTDWQKITAPIGRCDGSIFQHCVRPDGKESITDYKVIACTNDYSLLEVQLHTGRTHQIRIHMSHIGHPLVGDWLYGVEDKELFARPALHSYYLTFYHPFKQKQVEFEIGLPEDMKKFIEKYGIR